MSRKPKKGYFVRGQFVAEGSELDLELKPSSRAPTPPAAPTSSAKATNCRSSATELLTLRADLFDALLGLDEKLVDAIAEAKRITNFEGKRRQMQFIGKLMRKLDDPRCWKP
jgi:ribosome-associated protein